MHRAATRVRIVLVKGLDFGVLELIGGQDAIILTLCSVLPL